MTNPYSVTTREPLQAGVFGDFSTRLQATFLYREIEIHHPVELLFIYDGWWFRQRILIGEQIVWRRISWLRINREAEFQLPEEIDPEQRNGRVEIDFGPGLRILRFRIWIGEEMVYDEVS